MIGARSPAFVEAPVYVDSDQTDQPKYPVVVFSHGLSAHRLLYSGICCDLASHGYVVASVEHKDLSACLSFKRVPGPGVAEGDYDNYINEWIPYLLRPTDIFPLRNDQVCSYIHVSCDITMFIDGNLYANVCGMVRHNLLNMHIHNELINAFSCTTDGYEYNNINQLMYFMCGIVYKYKYDKELEPMKLQSLVVSCLY